MRHTATILLVESNASDRALAVRLLERELVQAAVTAVADDLALADALVVRAPHVAIVAADLSWANVSVLIGTIKRLSPGTAIVLFGRQSDIVALALHQGLACDGLVRKSSAGFVALPSIVGELLMRAARLAVTMAMTPPAPGPASDAVCNEDARETAEGNQIAMLAVQEQVPAERASNMPDGFRVPASDSEKLHGG
jgi:hypothetical protein